MKAKVETKVTRTDRELIYTRVFNAPRELVWEVWTKPEHIRHWWGPDGFTLTHKQMEVTPGGTWRFIMHGMGRDFPNKIVFTEVVEPERLVYRHTDDDDTESISFHVTVTLEDQAGKTRLTMRSTFASAAELDRVNWEYGAIEGGKQTIGRLAAYLESL